MPKTYITSAARAKFANGSIKPLIDKFGMGEIRSVIVATVWADGEPGGEWHIEQAKDKDALIRHLRAMITKLEGG